MLSAAEVASVGLGHKPGCPWGAIAVQGADMVAEQLMEVGE